MKLEEAGYDLPVREDSTLEPSNTQELKRLLALRDQDLMYAKSRAEKAINECEQVKIDLGGQMDSLEEEKNALLDYIEEMQGKNPESEQVA